MLGLALPGNRTVALRTLPDPKPARQQAVVQVGASGICGSELRRLYRRPLAEPTTYTGCTAGHEAAGEVIEVGQGSPDWLTVGQRVAIYHVAGCADCAPCRAGWMISCESPTRAAYGFHRDGGHADRVLAEANTLLPLPDSLSFTDGALVACGTATAHQALRRARVEAGMTVAIVGLGPVGLAATQLAQAMGATVLGLDPIPDRRDIAASLGAATFESADSVRGHAGTEGIDVTLDCSGVQAGRLASLDLTRRWGTVVFVGEGGTFSFEPSPLLISRQLTLMGSWVAGLREMADTLNFLDANGIHPERLVTHAFSLTAAKEAYETFDQGTSGKVIFA